MSDDNSNYGLILKSLSEKGPLKLNVIQRTKEAFKLLKSVLKKIESELNLAMAKVDNRIQVSFMERGPFDLELKIADDILILSMHSNVYTFDESHSIHKTGYLKSNPANGFCGMISVYNFLTDSFQYRRGNDVGYLIARMFVNHENHFFVEGKRQIGIDFNDFENDIIDELKIRALVESVVLFSLNFEMQTPPFDKVNVITVQEVMDKELASVVSTGKRLGFRFQSDSDIAG